MKQILRLIKGRENKNLAAYYRTHSRAYITPISILDPPVVIQDAVFGRLKIAETISTTDYGLHIISGSVAFNRELGSIDLRGILDELGKKYDIIILDSAPGFSPEVFAGMKACDELLICCQPRIPAIAGTLQTFRTADRLKIPVLG